MKKRTSNSSESLVSVITPLYNAAQFLEKTLESVRSQSYQNWEHILVDDFSTDTSLALATAAAQKDQRIKIIALDQNKGAAHARNLATDNAQGTYIAFLDADDLWHRDKLKNQIAFMQSQKCLVSFTSYVHIDDKGMDLGKRVKAMPSLSYKKQHSNNYLGNLTGVFNAEVLGKIKAPNIRKRQDWALWLEAIKKSGKPALGIKEDLAYYRIREDSMSANKYKLIKYNFLFYREYLRYSWSKSVFWLLRFFWEYFIVRPSYIERY